MKTGATNLITDVVGLVVGNAEHRGFKTGVTVLSADKPFIASVDVMGGAPGTRETDLLAPDKVVDAVDALVLSGGSAFGLDAASGVVDLLAECGRGYQVGPVRVPIVPAAIIFDLLGGGQFYRHAYGDRSERPDATGTISGNLYRELGRQALGAVDTHFSLGSEGAGTGATTANLKGGLGSASVVLDSGHTVGALVVANPHGSVVMPSTGQFWAAPFEVQNEFGGRGTAPAIDPLWMPESEKLQAFNAKANTTIAIIGTDASLNKAQLKRLAVSAQDGMARAIVPSHTPFDGDLVFALSTAEKPLVDSVQTPMQLGHAAALSLTRAIARAVFTATPDKADILPCWQERWGE